MYDQEQERWNNVVRTHWWGRGHYAVVKGLIADYLGKRKEGNLKCLDIGCSGGTIMGFLEQFGQAYGFDISLDGLAYRQDRSAVIQANAMQIPFKNESFDLITILDVAEHVDDDDLLFDEIYRVARKSATIFINVPAFSFFWRSHDVKYGHKRRYSRAGLKRLARNHLFRIERIMYLHPYFVLPLFFSVLLDKLCVKHLGKQDDFISLGPTGDSLLLKTLLFERRLLKHIAFPFGISLFGILKKQ
jgi:SAM-dependent methyltransferase